jgi:hypothetical protein
MKHLTRFTTSLTRFMAILLLFVLTPGVHAQGDPCDERILRSLTVAMLNCSGQSAECTTQISMAASNNIPQPHKAVIERAASKFGVNPNFIAALFLSEQGNVWKPFDAPYASSSAGASGPFQFMPGTWGQYKEDGNNDGVADIMNFEDAAHAAAKLAATGTNQTTPLGDLNRPFAPNTLIFFSAVYNWGGGNVQNKTTPDSPLSAAPAETENYMKNVHALISSDFTESGHDNYGPPRLPSGEPVSGSTGGASSSTCGGATLGGLVTSDPEAAKTIILTSPKMVWGNYGSATSQRDDINNCLTTTALLSIATMAEATDVNILVNALATDHGGCTGSGGSLHNSGSAIDIGYYGNDAEGEDRHTEEGDTLYRFLFDNRELLKIEELIWQYPPEGYQCINDGNPGECDSIYNAATMDQHYHHIHVGFTL